MEDTSCIVQHGRYILHCTTVPVMLNCVRIMREKKRGQVRYYGVDNAVTVNAYATWRVPWPHSAHLVWGSRPQRCRAALNLDVIKTIPLRTNPSQVAHSVKFQPFSDNLCRDEKPEKMISSNGTVLGETQLGIELWQATHIPPVTTSKKKRGWLTSIISIACSGRMEEKSNSNSYDRRRPTRTRTDRHTHT